MKDNRELANTFRDIAQPLILDEILHHFTEVTVVPSGF